MATSLETAVRDARYTAVVRVIRSHPEWTLGQLLSLLDGEQGNLVGRVSFADLCDERFGTVEVAHDGGPPIDIEKREQVARLRGEEFSKSVQRVLAEAPAPVGAAYLRARVGGPRWKLQAALRELEQRDIVIRTGVTATTRYRLRSPNQAGADHG